MGEDVTSIARMAVGGHNTIAPSAAREIARDAARMDRALLATGSALLNQLTRTTLERERTLSGERDAVPAESVAELG